MGKGIGRTVGSIVILVASASVVAYFLRGLKDHNGTSNEDQTQAFRQVVSNLEGTTAKGQRHVRIGEAPKDTSKIKNPPEGEFRDWIREQSKLLEAPGVNEQQSQEQVAKVAASLTTSQSRELLNTVRDPRASAGEKILSTYILVEGGGRSQGELFELIATPLENKEPVAAHSEEEAKGIREKSLRIMAIDGLASRAAKEPLLREAFAKQIPDIEDPYVRAYARDKLNHLRRQ